MVSGCQAGNGDVKGGQWGDICTSNCLDWLRRYCSIISRVSNNASSLPPGTEEEREKKTGDREAEKKWQKKRHKNTVMKRGIGINHCHV